MSEVAEPKPGLSALLAHATGSAYTIWFQWYCTMLSRDRHVFITSTLMADGLEMKTGHPFLAKP